MKKNRDNPGNPLQHWGPLARTFGLVAFVLLCAGLSSSLAANLLTNPGFESGITGWSGALRAGNTATVVTDSSGAHSGNNYCSALISDPAGWSSVAQGSSQGGWAGSGVDIAVSDQKFYQLSAWVKLPGGVSAPADVALRFRFQPSGDRWDVGQQTIADDSWHQLIGPWLNPRAGDNLLGYFEVHTLTGVAVYVDDCSLEESTGCTITGLVKDNSGNPVEGAQVQLKQAGNVLKTATSLANGSYTFHVEPLEGVNFDLNASKLNYSSPLTDVSVTTVAPPGVATAANIVLTALPMVTISGTATDAISGAPVADVRITVSGASGSLSTKTAANGTYSIVVAAGLPYMISAGRLPLSAPAQSIVPTTDTVINFSMTSAVLVGVYADGLTAGPITTWTNKGSLGGQFMRMGTTPAVAGSRGAYKAVYFDNYPMVLTNPETVSWVTAPATITGGAANYTVSAWLLEPDPVLPDQQTYLAWSKRGGPDGSNCEMVYGINGSYGAVGHWGDAADMSWGTPPTGGIWHNIIITFDGSLEAAYIDGVFSKSETKTIEIAPDLPIVLGSGYWMNGDGTLGPDIPFSGYVAQLEIFGAPANAEDAARLAAANPPMLPVATLQGKVVTSDGSTAAGYTIKAADAAGVVQAITTTGSGGTYSCVVGAPGTFTVSATKLGYVTMPAPQTRTVAIGDTVTLADFTASPSTISGILKDAATGNPIYNGVVQTGDDPADASSTVITDATGTYSLPGTGCGGVTVYADAVGYGGRRLVVTGTGTVKKTITLTAQAEPNSLNGNMEDLAPQLKPTAWTYVPWSSSDLCIDWSASPTAKTGQQSLFYCENQNAQSVDAAYSGIYKIVQLAPGHSYNWWFSAKADPECKWWQPLVEFMDADGNNWDGFVSADPGYYEYSHTPPYDWHTYSLWFDRNGTRRGTGIRWKPLANQTECHFIFLYEPSSANGTANGLPPEGKGCYLDDLVLDAVPDNLVVETVSPDANNPLFPVSGFTMPGGVPTFVIPTSTGVQYRLVYKNELNDADWTPVGTGDWTPGTGGNVTLTDPSAVGRSYRFYRLQSQG
jgi:hypothetical protein